MKKIEEKFKGEDKIHIVLDPDDIDSLLSIFTFSKNALLGKGPWADRNQWTKYAEVVEWMEGKIKSEIRS